MRVKDYKTTNILSVLSYRRKFKGLDKSLKRCSSLTEQKATLRGFYKDNNFTRDELWARCYTLQNKQKFGLKETIFIYIEFFVAVLSAFFILYLENKLTSESAVEHPFFTPWIFFSILIVIIIILDLMAYIEKNKYIQHEVPLREIVEFELLVIKRALAIKKETINYDDLIKHKCIVKKCAGLRISRFVFRRHQGNFCLYFSVKKR